MTPYAVVIPTLVRDTLADCLAALAAAIGPAPAEIVLVDDRAVALPGPLEHPLSVLGNLRDRTTVVSGGAHGPAAARNSGLRRVTSPWVVFLHDDVQVGPHWCEQMAADLDEASPETAGVQGVITVPLPAERRPTQWERSTAELARARWTTADMAYRTDVLQQVGGFDERFRRAHREDTDLALRVLDDGWRVRRGRRSTRHPVRTTGRWVSVRAQRGNADDALMLRLHGPGWRARAAAPRGRVRRHLAITTAGVAACVLAATGRGAAAAVAAVGWAVGTGEFAWARVAAGPRTRYEVVTELAASVVIPPVASWYWLGGVWRYRGAEPWCGGCR
ncbi:glycosyltransferase [Streptomyces sp. KM273126]|uniref:glycosyltransferase family 2 protein n=1 Tax=Streptomyces sp. KM273126 TaxID=2545247 RepID=UPI00103C2068|nr:glycosyltransferase [Streptomyces sp. KM273126]MBA2809932.1 glycosyltransferase [Streptomyces sp. KM273126]